MSLNQEWEDKERNQAKCCLISHSISENYSNVDLIIYPEMTLTGFSVVNEKLSEFESDSRSIAFFKELSIKTGINHIFGLAIKDIEHLHLNRCCYVDKTGNLLVQYDKMHTFSFAGESDLFLGGINL